MILTITPNPLLNYAVHDQPGQYGERRCQRLPFTVGGKGINVARMLKSLGRPALALSFIGGNNGNKIKTQLQEQSLFAKFVATQAESRVGFDIFRSEPRGHDWWIEEGDDLLDAEVDSMLALIETELEHTSYLAMSGTIPGNSQQDFYLKVLEKLRRFRGEIFIDARGKALIEACSRGGFFLKHNREEAVETFAIDPFAAGQAEAFFARLAALKIWGAMVTDGNNSVLLWDGSEIHTLFPAPAIEVSAVGCGDATLAGLIYGRSIGLNLLQAAVLGMAAGAADVECAGPCTASYEAVQQKLTAIKVKSSAAFRG